MMPGLLVGDRLVVSKYPYGWSYASVSFHLAPFRSGRLFARLPERGDIVIIDRLAQDGRREDLIKRVVGLPGDRVQMIGGRLWLNGRAVATRDMGNRMMPIDGNFHCDENDPDPERRFPPFAGARVVDASGTAVTSTTVRPRCSSLTAGGSRHQPSSANYGGATPSSRSSATPRVTVCLSVITSPARPATPSTPCSSPPVTTCASSSPGSPRFGVS